MKMALVGKYKLAYGKLKLTPRCGFITQLVYWGPQALKPLFKS